YTAPVITKGLRIVAGTMAVNLTGPLVIRDVSVQENVVIQGLRLSNHGAISAGLRVENCQGPVQIEGLQINDYYATATVVRFADCPDLTLIDCSVWAETNPIEMLRCVAQLTRCGFGCGGRVAGPGQPATPRRPAMTVTNSDVALLDTRVTGQTG